ncbi:MAG: hypothetical protein ACQKBT_10265 [Puniceicoccales bacterium]
MNLKVKYSVLLLTLGTLTAHAQWTLISEDDFESYTFGNQPGGNWQNTNNNTTSTTANQWVTDATGGDHLGVTLPENYAGSGNGLYYFDDDATKVARAGLNLNSNGDSFEIVMVSFDFAFNTVTGASGGFGVMGLTDAGNTSYGSPSNRTLSINLQNNGSLSWSGGTSGALDLQTAYNLSIVANGSDTSFSYDALDGSGERSVDSKTFDIYLDDVLLDSSVSFTTPTLDMGRFGITTFSGNTDANFLVDNMEFFTAIPEPSSSSMIIGLSAALALFPATRRARRR